MSIQAVIFDIGGVLIRTEDLEPRHKWERRFGLPDWGLAKIVFDNPAAIEATRGRAGVDAVWVEVARHLSLTSAEVAELREDFWSGDRLDIGLLNYIRTLKPRYKTGLLSNAWTGAREYHRPWFNETVFDEMVFSCEEEAGKPAPEIYRRALTRLKVAPEEVVFVDDFIENIEAARALGMAGVHFKKGVEVRAELEKLGIR